MDESKKCLEIINFLMESGKNPDSFALAFPFIHHFRERGGDSSLEGFIAHCENCEIKGITNLNVYNRLVHMLLVINLIGTIGATRLLFFGIF